MLFEFEVYFTINNRSSDVYGQYSYDNETEYLIREILSSSNLSNNNITIKTLDMNERDKVEFLLFCTLSYCMGDEHEVDDWKYISLLVWEYLQ